MLCILYTKHCSVICYGLNADLRTAPADQQQGRMLLLTLTLILTITLTLTLAFAYIGADDSKIYNYSQWELSAKVTISNESS